VSCELIAGAAIMLGSSGGCLVRGGIDVRPPSVVVGTSSNSSGGRWSGTRSGAQDDDQTGTRTKYDITTTGYQPTNDIEEIALKNGLKSLRESLDRMQKSCGFTYAVEIMYAVPMKAWVGAEGWGNHRGCTNEAEHGGCINLSVVCGSEVASFWGQYCGSEGEGVKREYKGWNNKVKKVVCRGEASPPEASAMDHQYSRMKAALSKDGTLTVTLHPSDSNVDTMLFGFLNPRLEAD
jgi:hypothetical protein